MHGIFIVGTGRCGSTMVSNIVRAHPSLLSLSEFFYGQGGKMAFSDTKMTGVEFQKWLTEDRNGSIHNLLATPVKIPELLCDREPAGSRTFTPLQSTVLPHLRISPDEFFAKTESWFSSVEKSPVSQHYLRLFENLCKWKCKQHWIERSGGSIAYLDKLDSMFPNSKFVHLIRDGRECAISMSKHPLYRFELEKIIYGSSSTPQEALSRGISLVRFGSYWSAMVVRGCRRLRRIPKDRRINIYYEALCENPYRETERLMRFVGVSTRDAKSVVEGLSDIKKLTPQFQNLSSRQKKELSRSCRPGEKALNDLADE